MSRAGHNDWMEVVGELIEGGGVSNNAHTPIHAKQTHDKTQPEALCEPLAAGQIPCDTTHTAIPCNVTLLCAKRAQKGLEAADTAARGRVVGDAGDGFRRWWDRVRFWDRGDRNRSVRGTRAWTRPWLAGEEACAAILPVLETFCRHVSTTVWRGFSG